MNIEIDNRNTRYTAFSLHQPCSYCGIIEHTKPFATIGMRVMRAACEVDGI